MIFSKINDCRIFTYVKNAFLWKINAQRCYFSRGICWTMDSQAKQSNFLISSQRQAHKQDTTATNEARAEEVETKQIWVLTRPLPKTNGMPCCANSRMWKNRYSKARPMQVHQMRTALECEQHHIQEQLNAQISISLSFLIFAYCISRRFFQRWTINPVEIHPTHASIERRSSNSIRFLQIPLLKQSPMLQCNNRRQTQADRQATTGRQAVEHRITHTRIKTWIRDASACRDTHWGHAHWRFILACMCDLCIPAQRRPTKWPHHAKLSRQTSRQRQAGKQADTGMEAVRLAGKHIGRLEAI